jgi:hypothetical protein
MAVTQRSRIAVSAGVVLLFGAWLYSFALRRSAPAVSEREYATHLLAKHLRAAANPREVLVIGNPFAKLPDRPGQVYDFEKAGVTGLERGLGAAIHVVTAHPALKPEVLENPSRVQIDPTSPTPLSFMVDSAAFDELIRKHPKAGIVVSLIGLPVNLRAFEAWNKPGAPRFALLLPDWRIIGDSAAIRNAFETGKLLAAVAAKPGATDAAGATAVEERYLLIHSNNVADVLQAHPKIFWR